uniref:Chemosensory protein n=1 Tax=Cnaphalocrocis medinalis TaxID=437488 RepID=A0A0A1CTG8_CNAME|nr:chemosensory protein [Cnaphalocrocis medinalis]
MKFLVVLSMVFAVAVADTYKTTHDSIDVEAVVTNPDSLKAFTGCFLDTGACNEVAASFKKVLPEATEQACAKCTPAQKHMLRRYLEEVKKTSPEDFAALNKKYDPEGKYVEALRAAIANA